MTTTEHPVHADHAHEHGPDCGHEASPTRTTLTISTTDTATQPTTAITTSTSGPYPMTARQDSA